MKSKIETSIIIPTYKRKVSIIRLLKSLIDEINEETELIIVEQGENHKKDYMNLIQNFKLNFVYINLSLRSTSMAKNVGAKIAKGNVIIFFDDDVVVKKGIIKNHLKNYKDKKIGGVAGRVITPGQMIELNNRRVGRVSKWGTFSDGYSSDCRQFVDTVIGCNASWRKHLFHKVGGFDEKFSGNAMREESDLSLRIKAEGYKIIFDPHSEVTHLREASGGNRKTEGRTYWYYHFFSNETYFYLKHFNIILLPLILTRRLEWILRCMFGFNREISINSISTPFKGIIDGYKKYKSL